MHRFAWLELDGGTWHFLTHLYADPRVATRCWSDCRHALRDLLEEGWTVVGPYPRQLSVRRLGGGARGYGLTRTIH